MNVLVEVPNSKAKLALEVFNNLSFVLSAMPVKPSKKEIFLNGLEGAAKEVKEHIAGKKKLKTLDDVLSEL